jgi:hypothetical protein
MSYESSDTLKKKANDLSIADVNRDTSLGPGHVRVDTDLPPQPVFTLEQEKKLWRKIDLRLMPILSLMYLFSFMDRGRFPMNLPLWPARHSRL